MTDPWADMWPTPSCLGSWEYLLHWGYLYYSHLPIDREPANDA